MTSPNPHERLASQQTVSAKNAGNLQAETDRGASLAVTNQADEQWYLRIDGQVFGPATRDGLERFLRPPRLCKTMEVRCSSRINDWHVMAHEETLHDLLRLAGIALETAAAPEWTEEHVALESWASRQIGRAWITFVSWLKILAAIIAIVGALTAVGFAIHWAAQDPQAREREIFIRFESLWDELQAYRADDADEAEWRSFADSVITELDPILVELGKTADVRHSVRQNLLYAGREQLRPLLQAEQAPAGDSLSARVFERYLLIVKQELTTGSPILKKRR